jgi:hypothetical protein
MSAGTPDEWGQPEALQQGGSPAGYRSAWKLCYLMTVWGRTKYGLFHLMQSISLQYIEGVPLSSRSSRKLQPLSVDLHCVKGEANTTPVQRQNMRWMLSTNDGSEESHAASRRAVPMVHPPV